MPASLWPWFFFALACAMMHAGPAGGHSWYDRECCSAVDCKPVDVREIGESGADYTYQGLRLPKTLSRPSQDERWHACVLERYGLRQLLCVYRPTPGS